MLKQFLEKWRLWEEAFLGIDDLLGRLSGRAGEVISPARNRRG
jgi:hypothetical protein